MIYTVTFNPAIDYIVHTGTMQVGQVNRPQGEELYFGGKGINVSFVLHELGLPSKALVLWQGLREQPLKQAFRSRALQPILCIWTAVFPESTSKLSPARKPS